MIQIYIYNSAQYYLRINPMILLKESINYIHFRNLQNIIAYYYKIEKSINLYMNEDVFEHFVQAFGSSWVKA